MDCIALGRRTHGGKRARGEEAASGYDLQCQLAPVTASYRAIAQLPSTRAATTESLPFRSASATTIAVLRSGGP